MGARSINYDQCTRGGVFKFVQFATKIEGDCSQGTKYLAGFMLWSILHGGNSAPENEYYAQEIVGTRGYALLPDRTLQAKPRSKTPRVYRPFWPCLH